MGLPTLACGDRPHEVARTVCWAPHVMASKTASETASMTDSVMASASSAPQALSLPGGSRSQPPSFVTRSPLSVRSLSWVSLCRATLLTPSLQPLRNGDRPPHGPTAMGTRGSRPTGWRSAFCLSLVTLSWSGATAQLVGSSHRVKSPWIGRVFPVPQLGPRPPRPEAFTTAA